MCSSGRGYDGPTRPIGELLSKSQRETEQREYEVQLEAAFRDALSDFNDRNVKDINTHLDTIEHALSKDIDEAVELVFGGSVMKHTYVDGLSDVDMLVCLNDTSLESKTPQQALDHFAEVLHERLPDTEIKQGDLAVTVKFSDGTDVQLLPAIKTATGCRIANPSDNRWSNVIRPEAFARKLTQINEKMAGKVIPTVKLIKAMNEGLPKPARLSGYHIESLAIQIFEDYDGRDTHQAMVKHFWQKTQSAVLAPISDPTGQSRHVDDYLGSAGSAERRRVSVAITRMVERIKGADESKSVDRWKEMLEI